MKVFFDTNVVLDWLLKREPTFAQSSRALRETIRLGHTGVFSSGMLNDIYYVLKKELKSSDQAREKVESVLSLFRLAKVDEDIIAEALRLRGRDFEDDIVVATAIGCGADCLVTNNVKDFLPSYPDLKIYNPSEYLEMLGQ